MKITGTTRLMGLLGRGISYTLSPQIHNFSARQLSIDIAYVPFDLDIKNPSQLLDLFWDMGVMGFNVTTPYKTLIAKALGNPRSTSVNTVYRQDDKWVGVSTDAAGFAHAVAQMGLSLEGFRRIIILGAGGAVAALLAYIAAHFDKFPEVVILRRDSAKDSTLTASLPESFKIAFQDFDAKTFQDLVHGAAGETLVIQATNAPQRGDNLARFASSFERYNGSFVDLVYGKPSALLTAAQNRGIPCQDGLPMLIEQARLAQKYWWNQSAAFDDIHRYLTGLLTF